MSSPEDERDKLWTAIHVNGDRITELEAVVSTRNEMLRETVKSAVQDAMPKALLNDEQHEWVSMAFAQWKDRAAFRKKIIESAAIWAVPLLILAGLTILREYAINHGMWRP